MRGRLYWKSSRDYEIRSPSKQVKGNAMKLRQYIQEILKLKKPIWIESIIVFTNQNVELELNKPTVPVLRVEELFNFIKNKKPSKIFSKKELELIGESILKQQDNSEEELSYEAS